MKVGYARVSTAGQARYGTSLEEQKEKLLEAGADKIYEETYTGKTTVRPVLQSLLNSLKSGDSLLVTKLDRIARSAREGLELVDKLSGCGVSVHILNMGLFDDSPTGRLQRTILFAFAEYERDLILERTAEGKARARATDPDYHEGRKPKFKKAQVELAMRELETHTYTQVEQMTGISKSTLIREKRARKAERESAARAWETAACENGQLSMKDYENLDPDRRTLKVVRED